jgi:hypothetical protein
MNMPERRDAWIYVPHAPLAPMAPWHFRVASETEGRGYLLQIASLGSLTATPPRLNPSVCKNSQSRCRRARAEREARGVGPQSSEPPTEPAELGWCSRTSFGSLPRRTRSPRWRSSGRERSRRARSSGRCQPRLRRQCFKQGNEGISAEQRCAGIVGRISAVRARPGEAGPNGSSDSHRVPASLQAGGGLAPASRGPRLPPCA